MLRPIVLFAAAYTIVGILHESAHAAAAYVLKVPSTLFHLNASLDRLQGTISQRGIIAVAGPLFCFGLGLVCWLMYRRMQSSRSGLLLLYLVMFGMGTFFGNLISTSFVGDFSRVAQELQLPMPIRYGASITGALLICGLSFFVGTELRRWAPDGVSGVKTMIGLVVVPVIVGTALAILIFLPMPWGFAIARMGESLFWIFGAIGALLSPIRRAASGPSLGLGWEDFAILAAAVAVVGVMAGGIALTP